jgi:arginine decarboxylase
MKTPEVKIADETLSQDLANVLAAAVNRTDQWRELHALSRAWVTATPQSEQAESLRAEGARLLRTILRLEQCWAYPGPRLLSALNEAVTRRDVTLFVRLVQKISAALLSGDYRRNELAWDPAAEGESRALEGALPPDMDKGEANKPGFEVLIVTPTDPANWERARADMKRMRRTEDQFHYDVVHVGSFEDAALAVLVNDNIQAVVLVDGFQYSSRLEMPDLKGFLNRHLRIDRSSIAPGALATVLAKAIKNTRPELDILFFCYV